MAPRGGFNGAGGTRGGRGSSSTHSSSGGVSASVGGLSLGSSGGEDQVSSSIAHREGLQQLWIDGVTLMPSGSISTVIRDSFKTYMSHEGFTWRLVPDNAKEIYFDEFKEEVNAIAKEQSQPLPGTTEPREINMTAIYLDVVGVSKKNRVFGIGCRSRKYTKCGSRASSSQDLGVASEEKIKAAVDAQLQMRLDAQRAEMRQEIQAQMQAQVEAQVQSQVQVQLQAHLEEQKKVFEQMLAQFKSGSGHSPPS